MVGGLALRAWGRPKRKVDGALLGMAASGLFGMTLLGIGRTPLVWMVAAVEKTIPDHDAIKEPAQAPSGS